MEQILKMKKTDTSETIKELINANESIDTR